MVFPKDVEIKAFDFIATKALRYLSRRNNANQLYIVALSTGEVIIKNPFGDLLIKFQTDLGNDIVNVGAPQTTDESYFTVLNRKGVLKIFNYTIIEAQPTYNKYIRDNFGVRRFNDTKTEEEMAQTP